MTPEELAAAVALICGEEVAFEYSVRTKRGKATSTWKMRNIKRPRARRLHDEIARIATGPTKAAAMEQMVELAVEWADKVNERRARMRELRAKAQKMGLA